MMWSSYLALFVRLVAREISVAHNGLSKPTSTSPSPSSSSSVDGAAALGGHGRAPEASL